MLYDKKRGSQKERLADDRDALEDWYENIRLRLVREAVDETPSESQGRQI